MSTFVDAGMVPVPDAANGSAITGTTIAADTGARHARKYQSGNPVQRWLLGRFFRVVRGWLDQIAPRRVLDFGCGEAFFWQELARMGPLPEVVGIDLRTDAVAAAGRNCPGQAFHCCDLFEFDPPSPQFDLAVCSEVLEHLHDPGRHLVRVGALAERVLVTVPHEPYFQACNLLRGRDLRRLGNHPEHVQHWSAAGFTRFLADYLIVDEVTTSFPFILAHGRPRPASELPRHEGRTS